MRLAVPISRLVRLLLWAAVGLHVLSLTTNAMFHGLGWHLTHKPFGRLAFFFNIDKEKNLPTWFSAGVLMLAAFVLWQIAGNAKASGDRYARHWSILGFVFAFLSLDEVAQVHEVASRSGILQLGRASYLSWLVIAAPFVIIFAVSYLRFLTHLPAKVRWLMVAAGIVYVGGAGGMEIVGALFGRDLTVVTLPGVPYLKYLLYASVEELMEMIGSITFVYAAASYLQQHQQPQGAAGASAPVQAAGIRMDVNSPVGALGSRDSSGGAVGG